MLRVGGSGEAVVAEGQAPEFVASNARFDCGCEDLWQTQRLATCHIAATARTITARYLLPGSTYM